MSMSFKPPLHAAVNSSVIDTCRCLLNLHFTLQELLLLLLLLSMSCKPPFHIVGIVQHFIPSQGFQPRIITPRNIHSFRNTHNCSFIPSAVFSNCMHSPRLNNHERIFVQGKLDLSCLTFNYQMSR